MLGNVNWRRFVNEKLTGRKVNRWLLTMVQAAIGVAISAAALNWGVFGKPFPPIPGESIIVASIPFIAAQIDNFFRTSQTRSMIHMGAAGALHQHGGAPETP